MSAESRTRSESPDWSKDYKLKPHANNVFGVQQYDLYTKWPITRKEVIETVLSFRRRRERWRIE